jgi:hypothetical protein
MHARHISHMPALQLSHFKQQIMSAATASSAVIAKQRAQAASRSRRHEWFEKKECGSERSAVAYYSRVPDVSG